MRALMLTILLCFPVAAQARASDSPARFAGVWNTTYGQLTLVQDGTRVSGVYLFGGAECEIEGTVSERTLTFTYREPTVSGRGSFELSADGNSFRGKWKPDGGTEWAPWKGSRLLAEAPLEADHKDGFAGLWETSFGRLRIHVRGSKARGTYSYASGSRLEGTVKGNELTFTYEEPGGIRGEGTFELGPGERMFSGRWRQTHAGGKAVPTPWASWSGARVTPVPGVTWLVVLEAHWERSIAQHEYSYGDMLRAYFSRVPSVHVRHRYFHDEADLRRFASEVAYLAEPVVLYISSHGAENGVQAGGHTIGGDAISESLEMAGDIRLLHFGSCLVMKGDIPRQIQKARGARAFPISGFTRTADWAGSAVIDFTYLELVMSRGIPPEDAAASVRKMISFAREDGDDVIAPAGLAIRMPH